jgi:ankyrin repeat protein
MGTAGWVPGAPVTPRGLTPPRPHALHRMRSHGDTPLILAALHERPNNLRLLLAHRADVHAKSTSTCASLPPRPGRPSVCAAEPRPAPVWSRYWYHCGYDALHCAAYNGNTECIAALIAAGADQAGKDDEG